MNYDFNWGMTFNFISDIKPLIRVFLSALCLGFCIIFFRYIYTFGYIVCSCIHILELPLKMLIVFLISISRRCYIRFIRKVNDKKGLEGNEETRKSFVFMLNFVGRSSFFILS